MIRSDVHVVVHTTKGRKDALLDTLQSIRDSDLGAPDGIVTHDAATGTIQTAFLDCFEQGRDTGKRWTLRFEDDVIVHPKILEALTAWAALREPDFGAGWLFRSYATWAKGSYARSPTGAAYWPFPELVQCQAVLVPNAIVPAIIPGVKAVWDQCEGQQDRALSRALTVIGQRVYVHEPPLVEHDVKHQSLLAPNRPVYLPLHTTMGGFDPEWAPE